LDASSILAISTSQLFVIIKIKTIRRIYRKPFVKKEPKTRINENIFAREARIIDEEGNQLGIMPVSQALAIAKERVLDLVEISPKVSPPVCKIMDFGKFQYQKSKEERQHKAKQKKLDIKGIRLSVRTNEHDLNFKKDQAEKFLTKGNKVKIEISLKGREKAYQHLAREGLMDFVKKISIPNKIEQELKRYPGGYNIIISPQ
jgi:translation initiation factor IF-3